MKLSFSVKMRLMHYSDHSLVRTTQRNRFNVCERLQTFGQLRMARIVEHFSLCYVQFYFLDFLIILIVKLMI
jgi:hypothetical protein